MVFVKTLLKSFSKVFYSLLLWLTVISYSLISYFILIEKQNLLTDHISSIIIAGRCLLQNLLFYLETTLNGGLFIDVKSCSVFIKISHAKKCQVLPIYQPRLQSKRRNALGRSLPVICIFFAPTQNNILQFGRYMLNFKIRNFCSKVNHILCLTSLVAKECSGNQLVYQQ